MLKEMYEQPKTVTDTISPASRAVTRYCDRRAEYVRGEIRAIRKIFIVACGSAYHAGVTGKYVIEGIARIPVEVDVASELFRYRRPILEEGTMVIVISQSGETADTLTWRLGNRSSLATRCWALSMWWAARLPERQIT